MSAHPTSPTHLLFVLTNFLIAGSTATTYLRTAASSTAGLAATALKQLDLDREQSSPPRPLSERLPFSTPTTATSPIFRPDSPILKLKTPILRSERPALPPVASPLREFRSVGVKGDFDAEALRRVSGQAARRRIGAGKLGRENVLPGVVEVFLR
ncbi:hypothetical protein MBLNU230_g8383t1 [Neophaeotheca triangularis]